MIRRQLGSSTLRPSAIGFGCMGLSGIYGARDETEGFRVLARARDLGIDFFDTANSYGGGHNEEMLGRAFAGSFGDIVIATKCGFTNRGTIDCTPTQIKLACEDSLRRLGIETIDLYYLHRADPQVPIEDSVGAIADLVSEGKVRYVGLSEVSGRTLRRAVTEHPIAAVQSEYSLFTRDVECDVLPVCRELGVGLVPFSPLGRGMLTGKLRSSSDITAEGDRRATTAPRFSPENLDVNLALLESVETIAAEVEASVGQVALAWVLAQGDDVIPIPGTGRIGNLEENVASLEVGLSEAQIAVLNDLAERVAGARQSGPLLQTIGVDTPARSSLDRTEEPAS